VLRAYEVNFRPKGRLVMITNDLPHLRDFCERAGVGIGATFTSDSDWLSDKEMKLPGWYRQQIIKLRSYEFCETTNFCNLGADTVLLQPIELSDLVDDEGFPILYYSTHPLHDIRHVRFEKERIRNIGRILQTPTTNAERYVDFINDLFCFNGGALRDLNTYMERFYGSDPYATLLRGFDDDVRNKFGEWSLYSTYLLDVLKRPVTLRNTKPDFLYQVHGKLSMLTYRYDTKVAHFVSKEFDVDRIAEKISQHNLELSRHL
jgi:hypothetical protein